MKKMVLLIPLVLAGSCGKQSEVSRDKMLPTQRSEVSQEKTKLTRQLPSSEQINVSFNLELVFDSSGKLQFVGETNLPDGMELGIDLDGPNVFNSPGYIAQTKVQVVAGKFVTEWFSHKGQPLRPGKYKVNIHSPYPSLQPSSVQQIIGPGGMKLSGPHVRRNFLKHRILWEHWKLDATEGISHHVDYTQEFEINDDNKQRLEGHKTAPIDCYNLGYRYARYGALGLLVGIEGPPEDKHLVIPVECRQSEETRKGMIAGVESVFKEYNIKGYDIRSGTTIYNK
jgi:hypothetical protein